MRLIDVLAVELTSLPDPMTFLRGRSYRDRVVDVSADAKHASATVRGTMPYQVELHLDDDTLKWSCTCPVGKGGTFCKHGVALALTISSVDTPPEHTAEKDSDHADLSSYLSGLDRQRLVELVTEASRRDWRLQQRLLAEAQHVRGDSVDIESWKDRIEAVFAPYDHGFVPYDEATGWAADIEEVIDALGDLVLAGYADSVIRLVEHAHTKAEAAIQYVDDSDGQLGSIFAALA